jgi:hypothetical protein
LVLKATHPMRMRIVILHDSANYGSGDTCRIQS